MYLIENESDINILIIHMTFYCKVPNIYIKYDLFIHLILMNYKKLRFTTNLIKLKENLEIQKSICSKSKCFPDLGEKVIKY